MMEGWGAEGGGVAGTHSLSPESPEAAVGLQVLGGPHRSLSALHVCISVNWGVAAGRAVISFFKRGLKKKCDSNKRWKISELRLYASSICVDLHVVVHAWWSLSHANTLVQLIRSKLK